MSDELCAKCHYDCLKGRQNWQQEHGLTDADLEVACDVGRNRAHHVSGATYHHMEAGTEDNAGGARCRVCSLCWCVVHLYVGCLCVNLNRSFNELYLKSISEIILRLD